LKESEGFAWGSRGEDERAHVLPSLNVIEKPFLCLYKQNDEKSKLRQKNFIRYVYIREWWWRRRALLQKVDSVFLSGGSIRIGL
jgi:hypothetical protein